MAHEVLGDSRNPGLLKVLAKALRELDGETLRIKRACNLGGQIFQALIEIGLVGQSGVVGRFQCVESVLEKAFELKAFNGNFRGFLTRR
jgi:hypothetical protein